MKKGRPLEPLAGILPDRHHATRERRCCVPRY